MFQLLPQLATVNLNIDAHKNVHIPVLGTISLDIVWSTALAGLIVIVMGLAVSRKATSGVPSKLQVAYEAIIEAVSNQVSSTIGERGAWIVPLAVALFFFILISNWVDLLAFSNGSDIGQLAAPSASVNFTFALAFFVIILVHISSIRSRGLKGYIRHYFQPYKIMFPLNFIEELVKPLTLALRLFGNMFAGAMILIMIGALILHNDHTSVTSFWVPIGLVFEVGWKLFDMAVGVIQAFIFSLLTIIYFEFGMAQHEEAH